MNIVILSHPVFVLSHFQTLFDIIFILKPHFSNNLFSFHLSYCILFLSFFISSSALTNVCLYCHSLQVDHLSTKPITVNRSLQDFLWTKMMMAL